MQPSCFQKVWKILLSIIPLYDNATVRKSGRKPDGLNFRFLFFFRPLHQRGPPIIRNKNPYPEFHGKEAEIYQPQTRYEELPRLAPPREEFRDTGM